MIVISLAMVIAAAVSLFIGLFVVTDSLTFIFVAIGLCLLSLLLLWLGTRSRKAPAPATASAPVYGGGTRSGGATTPARASASTTPAPASDEVDADDDVEGATIVRRTTARDRAAARVSEATTPDEDPGDEGSVVHEADEVSPTPSTTDTPGGATPAPVTKKATGRPARKATGRPVAKKAASTRPATTAPAAATGDAKAVLAGIAGVGPAKQDALLAHYGSLDAIRAASVEDIVANVKGFGTALATRVKDELS